MIQHYREVRARLMRPPLPVVDRGIDLRRPRGLVPSRDPLPLPWWAPVVVDITPVEPEWMAEVIEWNEAWREICGVESETPRLTIDRIQRVVCTYFGIRRDCLLSTSRVHGIVRPRMIAMYLARKLTLTSWHQIGLKFGGRDHTTIMSAAKKIGRLRATDTTTNQIISQIEAML